MEFGLKTLDGELLKIQALVVPFIYEPLSSQPIMECQDYEHLANLDLADSVNASDYLEVDLLVGSDHYWSLVTGRVRRGKQVIVNSRSLRRYGIYTEVVNYAVRGRSPRMA